MQHRLLPRHLKACLLVGLVAAIPLASAEAAQPSALPKLSLTVSGSSITASGAMQSGAVNVVTSTSLKKGATGILFRLKPGVSAAELQAFISSKKSKDANAASKYGSIVFDTEAAAGHPSEAQTVLQPGSYVALGAKGHGPPKFQTSFSVTASAAPAALPKPKSTVRSIEFDFRGPSTLHDGELVRFVNSGYLVHMDIAFPVKSKKAAKEAMGFLLKGQEKKLRPLVSGAPVSFAGPLSTGAFQQETITAKPGWYVQVCFMETQEGVTHTRLGMERALRIVK